MAITKTIVIKADTSDAVKNVKKLDKSLDKTGDQAKQTSAEMSTLTGGAGARFAGLIKGIKGVALGFKSLKFAIAASGIGLLLIAVVAITAAFKNTEAGQNKFAKLMGVIGSVVGNVVDVIADLGNFIIDLFSGDGEAITKAKEFGKKLFDVVGLPIKTIIDVVKTLGKILGSLFSGDISGAFDALSDGVQAIKGNFDEAKESIDAAKDSIIAFGRELADDAEKAAKVAELRAKADLIDRDLIVQRAQADQKIAELRFKSEQRKIFTAAESVKFLKEASAVAEDIANKEIKSAKIRLEAQIIENTLAGSKKADLNKVAELSAKVIGLDTQKLNLQKRLVTSIISFQNTEKAGLKAISDAKKKQLEEDEKVALKKLEGEKKTEEKRLQSIADIREQFRIKNQDLEDTTELEKIEREKERALAELERLNATEEQKAELIKFFAQKRNDEQFRLNEEQFKLDEEARIKEERLDKAVGDAKVDIAQNTLGLIAGIVKRGSVIGKAVAVAQATISGIEGVQNAFTTAAKSPITTLFPPYPFIQAGLAGAFSALQIQKILSINPSKGGGSAAASSGGVRRAAAPAFNLVAGSGTNQIAEGLANEPQPLRAFVVSSDQTSAAAIDRNIVETSSFG